jgi:hypothetical protein
VRLSPVRHGKCRDQHLSSGDRSERSRVGCGGLPRGDYLSARWSRLCSLERYNSDMGACSAAQNCSSTGTSNPGGIVAVPPGIGPQLDFLQLLTDAGMWVDSATTCMSSKKGQVIRKGAIGTVVGAVFGGAAGAAKGGGGAALGYTLDAAVDCVQNTSWPSGRVWNF